MILPILFRGALWDLETLKQEEVMMLGVANEKSEVWFWRVRPVYTENSWFEVRDLL